MKARVIAALVVVLALPSASLVMAGGEAVAWKVPGDFATIQDAVDDPMVMDGDTIRVGKGSHAGALLDKSLNIVGKGKAVIDDGPVHSSGFIQGFRLLAGSEGSRIAQLTFEVDFSIMNGAAVDDIQVDHNNFNHALQAISNWLGSGWNIHHNVITDLRTSCGGGIGILVADWTGEEVVSDNLIEHNTIEGTLHVDTGDCGGYSGSGIVFYGDYRWSREGTEKITRNRVTFNKVGLISDNPGLVDVVAFELTDTRDDPSADPFPVIFENSIGFNDFRGTANQTSLTPMELEDHNVISRNLGSNRGHGVHPGKIFDPGS